MLANIPTDCVDWDCKSTVVDTSTIDCLVSGKVPHAYEAWSLRIPAAIKGLMEQTHTREGKQRLSYNTAMILSPHQRPGHHALF